MGGTYHPRLRHMGECEIRLDKRMGKPYLVIEESSEEVVVLPLFTQSLKM